MILLPERKVPTRFNGISGLFPSAKNGRDMAFESLLERKFMLLLEFDSSIHRYTEQPITISYKKAVYKGGAREPGYTPDLLVYYKQQYFAEPRWPDLVEIKPAEDFGRLELESADKYSAAAEYARSQNWHFVKWSELLINSQRLANAEDLYKALVGPRAQRSEKQIVEYMMTAGEATQGAEIIRHFGRNPEVITAFRYLIASKRLETDWKKPISLSSTFELSEVNYDD